MNKIQKILLDINPEFKELIPFIEENINKLKKETNHKNEIFSEKQTVLITYADQFQSEDHSPLHNLGQYLKNDLEGEFSHVHILPFYPWTCDDGFGVSNFQEVEPTYGTWQDIKELPSKTMFDCVFNHVSSQNDFFKKALHGDEDAQKMFHIVDEQTYLSPEFQEQIKMVVRPRTSPLFTPFLFSDGVTKYVWTTFSDDQVDTNISNVMMVHHILESLFLYIQNGAEFFRIDAVPFMWKELGTNCSHLEKTHLFVKLLRAIIEEVDSRLLIITESNVPHHENISYWGSGDDEAHVIYNFSLAPLILHALSFKTNKYMKSWAKNVFDIGENVTYLNFTSTHDGIGVRGLEGIVPEEDVFKMCELTEDNGGHIGKKRSRDGSIKPYELNITWASYLKDNKLNDQVYLNKVVHSNALAMLFPGIGAHYVHNFLATENWTEGFRDSGIARRLNRKKLPYPISYNEFEKRCTDKLLNLVRLKKSSKAFHPKASIEIIDSPETVLAFKRSYQGESKSVYFNLTEEQVHLQNVKLDGFGLVICEE